MSRVITGDAFDVLANLNAESVHAVVTDPPYGLAFMGRDWDDFEPKEYQEWCERWARMAREVLKPGGHLVAFSGNRTHHRLFSGVEDAGFEVRDTLTWHYGSGFPKALDVGKQMDKYNGNPQLAKEVAAALKKARGSRDIGITEADERFCGGTTNYSWFEGRPAGTHLPSDDTFEKIVDAWPELSEYQERVKQANRKVIETREDSGDRTVDIIQGAGGEYDITAPATDAAREWDGFKTAMKPATEFIVLARKPFSGTVAENVQAHGTGALNIDGCRVGNEPHEVSDTSYRTASTGEFSNQGVEPDERGTRIDEGRYPANVIFDAEAAAQLDREVGVVSGGDTRTDLNGSRPGGFYDTNSANGDGEPNAEVYPDTGGPSRYFYTPKATRAERTLDGKIENAHPTVKPIDLMEWLVRLVTAEGQHVLDPFAGTGTTGRAAKNLGREFTLIERDPKWADVARARCGLTPDDPSLLTPEGQTTL